MKDSRQKYLDISHTFNNRATEIEMFCKQSQRVCELLANRLASKKPKTPAEFENNEYWKEFILKQAQNNQATIELLAYMKGLLIDVLEDSKVLMDGAILRDKLQFQSDTIVLMQRQNENITNETFNNRLNEIRAGHKGNS